MSERKCGRDGEVETSKLPKWEGKNPTSISGSETGEGLYWTKVCMTLGCCLCGFFNLEWSQSLYLCHGRDSCRGKNTVPALYWSLLLTKWDPQKKTFWHWVDNARSTQTPAWSSSFGWGLCSLFDVKLSQVTRFHISMRMRGEMLVPGEDDMIILIEAIASSRVLRQSDQQDCRMNSGNCLQQ